MKTTITIMEKDCTEHTYSRKDIMQIRIIDGNLVIFDRNCEYVESIPAEGTEIYIG